VTTPSRIESIPDIPRIEPPFGMSMFRTAAITKRPVTRPQVAITVTIEKDVRLGHAGKRIPRMVLLSPASTRHSERSLGGVKRMVAIRTRMPSTTQNPPVTPVNTLGERGVITAAMMTNRLAAKALNPMIDRFR
jgi:hypothetical protein